MGSHACGFTRIVSVTADSGRNKLSNEAALKITSGLHISIYTNRHVSWTQCNLANMRSGLVIEQRERLFETSSCRRLGTSRGDA
jgi:hypothetical protein